MAHRSSRARVLARSFFALVALAFGALLSLGCCSLSAPTYRDSPTLRRDPTARARVAGHFDGEHFKNKAPIAHAGFADFLKWRWTRDAEPWTEVHEATFGPPPPERVTGGGLRVTFVNHATTLIQQDGVNILTDPIWSERASPFTFIGPKRVRPPGIRFEDLPPIDAVLISHNHYDHFDLATLERIVARWPNVRIYVGLGNSDFLRKNGIHRGRDMDWGDSDRLGSDGVRIVSVENQHFSGRGLCDRDGTLWSAWAVVGPSGTTYFAGDTGYGDHFARAQAALGPIRLAILPIGAYRPEWFMRGVHQSPKEAVVAAKDLGAGTSVGMHFGTFPLADDAQDEPPKALARALEETADPPRFWVLGFGEGRDVPPL